MAGRGGPRRAPGRRRRVLRAADRPPDRRAAMARRTRPRHRRLHAQQRPPAPAARRARTLWHRVDRADLIGQFALVLRLVRTGLWPFSAFLARLLIADGGRLPALHWPLTAGLNRALDRKRVGKEK